MTHNNHQVIKDVKRMIAVRILQWIIRIVGIITLLLGLTIWFAQIELREVHMMLGIIVTLALLILSVILIFTQSLRLLGAGGVLYALIIPVFGMTQMLILPGDLHWLIQIAHMLVGIAAMGLGENMAKRFLDGKKQAQLERPITA